VEISLIDVEEQPTVAVRRQVRMVELADFLGGTFDAVAAEVSRAGLRIAGAPFARYRGKPTDVVDVEAGFPLTEPWRADGDLVAGNLPAARAIEAVHHGSYDELRGAYTAIEAWAAEHHVTTQEDVWELYEAGPQSDPDPQTWRTRIVWPIERPAVEGP